MIKFEGFELSDAEDNIVNRQPSTQPFILKQFMSALGAKKGKSWTEDVDWLSPGQREKYEGALEGLEGMADYKGAKYEGSKIQADALEGFKGKGINELRKLQDEGQLSVSGLDALRNMRASAATQVNPDIQALRGIGDKAWSGFDAQLQETTRGAREKLQQADIMARRGAGAGGTALARLGSRNVMDYGRTVGSAAARAVEQSAMQRQQLAMQARMGAGQLGMGVQQLGLQGLTTAGQQELGQLGLTAQDLAQRRGIASQERMFGKTFELDRARLAEQQAQAKNLFAQSESQFGYSSGLDRLRSLGDLASRRTREQVQHVQKGSAGLGGALLGAAGTIGGAYLGAQFGNPALGAQLGGSLTGSLVGELGYGDDGGGAMMGRNAGMMLANYKAPGSPGITPGESGPPGRDFPITPGNITRPEGSGIFSGIGDSISNWFGGGDASPTNIGPFDINTPSRGLAANPYYPRTGRANPSMGVSWSNYMEGGPPQGSAYGNRGMPGGPPQGSAYAPAPTFGSKWNPTNWFDDRRGPYLDFLDYGGSYNSPNSSRWYGDY